MTCGDTVTNWVPLLGSVWSVDATINDTAVNYVVTFTNVGSLCVIVDASTPAVYEGTYTHDHDARTLTWQGTNLPDTTSQYKFRTAAGNCDVAGKVLSGNGSVIIIGFGAVGTFHMSRVL